MENFNLKKFLVENKLTTNSRVINENIQLSPEAQDEVEAAIESWVPEDVEQTSDHMGEIIAQALTEIDGIEIPEGMFNNSMHNALLALSKEFHGGQIELPAAVIKAVSIVMDPRNYGKGI